MNHSTETSVCVDAPAVAHVCAALARHDAAVTQNILLAQRGSINDDSLHAAGKKDTPIGRAAVAFVESRTALNLLLREEMQLSQAAALELSSAFLSALFDQAVPGRITLPVADGRGSITENVACLQSLHERDGEVSGLVRTTSDGGRSGDTRWFVTRDGRAYFQDHVSL